MAKKEAQLLSYGHSYENEKKHENFESQKSQKNLKKIKKMKNLNSKK